MFIIIIFLRYKIYKIIIIKVIIFYYYYYYPQIAFKLYKSIIAEI